MSRVARLQKMCSPNDNYKLTRTTYPLFHNDWNWNYSCTEPLKLHQWMTSDKDPFPVQRVDQVHSFENFTTNAEYIEVTTTGLELLQPRNLEQEEVSGTMSLEALLYSYLLFFSCIFSKWSTWPYRLSCQRDVSAIQSIHYNAKPLSSPFVLHREREKWPHIFPYL